MGCSKYQVVSKVQLHLYHMHDPKKNKVELILTKDELQVGSWYRLSTIDILNPKDTAALFKALPK
jgi:hypothetical protein